MILNNIPTKRKDWHTTEVTLTRDDSKSIKKVTSFMIVHNLPINGNIDTIEAAVDNWFIRTDKLSEKSLIDYINSKSHMTNHHAMTLKDFGEKFPEK
jgi:hypothetical protein